MNPLGTNPYVAAQLHAAHTVPARAQAYRAPDNSFQRTDELARAEAPPRRLPVPIAQATDKISLSPAAREALAEHGKGARAEQSSRSLQQRTVSASAEIDVPSGKDPMAGEGVGRREAPMRTAGAVEARPLPPGSYLDLRV